MFISPGCKLFSLRFLLALFFPLFLMATALLGQTSNNLKTPKFPQKYELKDTSNVIDIASLNETIRHHREMIAKYPNEAFVPNLMFELTELTASKEYYEFNTLMNQYESDLENFEKGKTFRAPILPSVSYRETIETGYKLLEKYPNILYKDKVLYRLAISHLDEGNQDKAKEYLQQLISETPTSSRISEAHFRLGEYYFNIRDFDSAIEQYKYLLENWDDPYFNYSLYKLGWSYFNINDYANSISTFMYLISDISLLETMNTELLGKTKADVRNEAIDYIALSLTEYEGLTKVKELLGTEETKSYAIDVLKKMGEIYKKRNFYKDAISAYQILLDLFPFYSEAPLIQKEIIQCFENDLDEDRAAEAKDLFVKTYGPESDWLINHADEKARNDAVELSEEMLYSLGTHYQAKAQEKNRQWEYKLAIQNYEDFLRKFRNSDKAARVNYYLADCYYEIRAYDKAADEYYKVMTFYSDNEFVEDAAYNRILAYYQLLKEVPAKDTVTYYLEDFVGGGNPTIAVKVNKEAQFNLLKACNDYVRQLPASKNLLEVMMKYGEALYELHEWGPAARIYILTLSPEYRSAPFYAQSINMVALCYLNLGKYAESEKWFNNLVDAFPDSAQYVERAKKMVAAAKFKVAEDLKNQGKMTQAAVNFLKLAFSTKDQEIAKASIFRAANQFEDAGEIDKAIKAYQRMIQERPYISFKDELLMKLGLLYEKQENWLLASNNYMALVDQCPDSKLAPNALMNAASCFEQMKLWYKCKQTYRDYANRFAAVNPDDYIEVLYKMGEISYNQNDKAAALTEFQTTVQKFKDLRQQQIAVDEYLPAKAQFMIAEIYFERYNNIKIEPPLEVSLKQKVNLLNTVVKEYVEAGKYQVADWTTASLYKTGLAFEHLGDVLAASPIPAEYTSEEKQAYSEAINEQINSTKQKAIDVYKANVTNAKKNNIQNEWIDLSQKHMSQLMIDLGLGSQSDLTRQQNKQTLVPTIHINKGKTP